MSIYDKLKSYGENPKKPYHMPGHKFGNGFSFLKDPLKYDITEIDGFDNLQNPEGILKESEDLLSKTFKTKKSFFLINGSSSGIASAILTVVSQGEKIICARNAHKSLYTGLIFSGAVPYYVYPKTIPGLNIQGGITPENIKEAIEKCPYAKAVFIVSPTYEGFTSDIEKIAQIVHNHNKILIVDEAHGAHFGFSKYFPKSANSQGADIVIQSLHKTLPSMTQTAVIHINSDRVDPAALKSNINMMQSTSPSYILMSSIDNCRKIIDEKGEELFFKYYENLKKLRQNCLKLKNISLEYKDFLGCYGIYDFDIGKILIYSKNKNVPGDFIKEFLNKKYNIELEMCGLKHALAMTSICNDDFSDLEKAFFELDILLNDFENIKETDLKQEYNIKPKIYSSPRDAHFSKKTLCNLKDSLNKISGGFVTPYPPGIPLLCPGEVITEEILSLIYKFLDTKIEVIGIKDNLISVLEN